MAKQKKKRTKVYAGSTKVRPEITRIEAVQRSAPHQWWVDNKRLAKPVLIAAAVAFVIAFVVVEIIQLATAH